MSRVNLTIDGKSVAVEEGTTILEAAKTVNVRVPTLCHLNLEDLHMLNEVASCRICVVEVEGRRTLMPSCATPVAEGMEIRTNSKRVLAARRMVLELLLSDHPSDCLICPKSTNCELQTLAYEFAINRERFKWETNTHLEDTSSKALKRDPDKCIMCRRCETMCRDVQTVGVLTANTLAREAEFGKEYMSVSDKSPDGETTSRLSYSRRPSPNLRLTKYRMSGLGREPTLQSANAGHTSFMIFIFAPYVAVGLTRSLASRSTPPSVAW